MCSKRFRLLVGLLTIFCLVLTYQVVSYRVEAERAQAALAFARWRIECCRVRKADIYGIDSDTGKAIPIRTGRTGMGIASRLGQGGWTVSSVISYRMEDGHIQMYWAGIRDAPFELFLRSDGYEDQSICLGTTVFEPVTVRFSKMTQNRSSKTMDVSDLALPLSSNFKGIFKSQANPSATLVFNDDSLFTFREDSKKLDGFFYVCKDMVVLILPEPSDNDPEILNVKGNTLIDGNGDIWESSGLAPKKKYTPGGNYYEPN